jgi:hypothetical protein
VEQNVEQKKQPTKDWKRVEILDSYEVALDLKVKLLCEGPDNLEVKIRRYGDDKDRFQVKTYSPTKEKKQKK